MRPRKPSIYGAPLALLVLLLVLCLNATSSWARSNASCGALACRTLGASLSGEASAEGPESEAEGNGEEGEEGTSEDEGGSEAREGGEENSEENEEEATAEAQEEAEARAPGSGRKRHGASGAKGGRNSPAVLSKLHLTGTSIARLKTHDPVASRVEFTFSLAKSMKVRVTLVKQSKPNSHKHWTALSADSLTISAAKGTSRHRLTGGNRLSAGRYRLTLTPAHGRPRSIYVNVRR